MTCYTAEKHVGLGSDMKIYFQNRNEDQSFFENLVNLENVRLIFQVVRISLKLC